MSYIKAFFISLHCILIAILTIIVSPIDRKGKITHYLSKAFGGGILLIAGVKVETEGTELLDPNAEYIFISNHQSYFDIPVLMKAIPNNVRFIYRKDITKIPILGWGMYLGGYIPINRDNVREAMKSLKESVKKIKKGISVVIFPEGTRSYNGKLGDFKRGMFVLADEAKVPLVPTSVIGSINIMPRNKFQIKSGNVKVVFEKPVEYTADRSLLEDIKKKMEVNFVN